MSQGQQEPTWGDSLARGHLRAKETLGAVVLALPCVTAQPWPGITSLKPRLQHRRAVGSRQASASLCSG